MQIRRCLLLMFAAFIFSFLLADSGLAQSFTLEQVMSSPFPTNLVATKRGNKIGWTFDAEGKRNIWIAEAPAFAARQLTRYDKDDGGELTDLVFAPNGSWLAFARGNEQGKNSAGEYANPTSDPAGTKKEVFVADTRTGRVTLIGEGDAPMFNPAGDQIIYSREGKLWTAPLVGGKERRLFEVRGNIGAHEWSPDGSQLAFATNRGDHNFIGIYDPRAGTVRYLSPSTDRDSLPRWSADGKRIAFIRLLNISDNQSLDRERLQPWAIYVADVRAGDAKQIWHSGDQENDSYPSYPQGFGEFWQWVAGDRLLFPSEKDGWMHLYSISADGGALTTLTPGEFEVENIALTPDKSTVVFATNKNDIDRRHLWSINVAGGAPKQLTGGEGIEMYPAIFDNGRRVAFLHSTARDPFMPYSANIDGSNMQPLAPQALPSDFPSAQLVVPQQVIFKAADGLEIHGQLFKPKNANGKMPALIFTHGGPPRQMLLAWHYMYYYHNSYAMNQYLASHGYVVLSVNYRSGIGYGRAFRLAQHRGARGASEYQDVVAGAKYLQSRDDVDKKRIGLWGGSYGGYLTALGLARNSDIFAAGVDFHGVHDWSLRVSGLPLQFNSPEQTRVARESSPIAAVDKWKSPVLLIHGDDDRNVEFAQTVNLVRLLRKNNVYFEELIFPDEIHDLLLHKDWLRGYHAGSDFFDKHLK
ncbi:MAG TPA: prolyl oligopeptidase family serine peptidase [Pyrinomonadaceae bacterium]|jgi:dipeptidyl aminopeptidase/acylaminoacyl peptidase|nr:prolyl oligopeptidase family serine peptidase [Pyrinomonadaceae bacterium]